MSRALLLNASYCISPLPLLHISFLLESFTAKFCASFLFSSCRHFPLYRFPLINTYCLEIIISIEIFTLFYSLFANKNFQLQQHRKWYWHCIELSAISKLGFWLEKSGYRKRELMETKERMDESESEEVIQKEDIEKLNMFDVKSINVVQWMECRQNQKVDDRC